MSIFSFSVCLAQFLQNIFFTFECVHLIQQIKHNIFVEAKWQITYKFSSSSNFPNFLQIFLQTFFQCFRNWLQFFCLEVHYRVNPSRRIISDCPSQPLTARKQNVSSVTALTQSVSCCTENAFLILPVFSGKSFHFSTYFIYYLKDGRNFLLLFPKFIL